MGSEDRAKLLRIALVGGALLIVAVGVAIALAGGWFGWVIAAFGVIDLATSRFVLAAIEARRHGATAKPAEPPAGTAAPGDPTADPSYNPYARED
jgi:hypothetical protein